LKTDKTQRVKKLKLKNLKDFDLQNKNVFMRVDFNVPLEDGKIMDNYRITKSMSSIRFVLEKGGRLILASHLGRPKGTFQKHLSLKPIAKYLSEQEGLEVLFVEEADSPALQHLLKSLKKNQLILLENLRFHPGEEKKDKNFAKQMASYTDIYINEGFGISHRDHTSISLLPDLLEHKGLGLRFQQEIEKLNIIKNHEAQKPFIVILGGSKLKDKIPLMESLIDHTDKFLIGGLMAYTFLKAKGHSVGKTQVEPNSLSTAHLFINRLKERKKELYLPLDHVIELKGQSEIWNQKDIPKKSYSQRYRSCHSPIV